MRVVPALATLLPLVLYVVSADTSRRLVADKRGWYKCASSTFTYDDDEATNEEAAEVPILANFTGSDLAEVIQGELYDDERDAECAVFHAPLCYDGVCDDPQNRKVDVFFKRILANDDDPTKYPNVWFIQGGPGAASPAMESAMLDMHALYEGKINVYTMDHRGTGRSTKLDCQAAQATVSGGISGTSISPLEVPECAAELQIKYGDLAAFSITTAASDMATFISAETAGSETYVYGVSYGTAVVERLIHLKPKEVKGYIMDGIATTSGADESKFSYFSTWDRDYGETGMYVLEQCALSEDCAPKFQNQTLVDTVKSLIQKFEMDPESRCARLVNSASGGGQTPAMLLRSTLGSLVQYSSVRTLIPVLAYRLDRCDDNDVQVLSHYFEALNELLSGGGLDEETTLFNSDLLYYLIVFSDMWEQPMPSEQEMLERFTSTLLSSGGSYYNVAQYCAFSKEKSDVCDKYGVGNYEANPILYKRDQYWNVAAKIPEGSSALLMSSKADPQTPHKYAEYLLEAMDGELNTQKKLVTFEHATHGVLWRTWTTNDEEPTCAMQILMSYVNSKADLTKTDMSCLDRMPPINLKVPDRWVSTLLNTDDAYDGKFGSTAPPEDASQSTQAENENQTAEQNKSSENERNTEANAGNETNYKSPFIVFVVLFAVAAVAAIVLAVRLRKRKLANPDETHYVGVTTPGANMASSDNNRV